MIKFHTHDSGYISVALETEEHEQQFGVGIIFRCADGYYRFRPGYNLIGYVLPCGDLKTICRKLSELNE